MLRPKVLWGYARLIRASRKLFGEDRVAYKASLVEIRSNFEKHRDVRDAALIEERLEDIDDVEDMMLNNLVQGKRNDRGNYKVDIRLTKENPDSDCPPRFEPKPVTPESVEEGLAEAQGKTPLIEIKTEKKD
mmetsp:Transcript_16990/g.36986  ORF Transcript_16990/g.36986 Transcript_16990/m.36986 type:complete len:132 (+) Transcript_16990:122-517(+)